MQTRAVALAPAPQLMHSLPALHPDHGPGLSVNSTPYVLQGRWKSPLSSQFPERNQGDKPSASLKVKVQGVTGDWLI